MTEPLGCPSRACPPAWPRFLGPASNPLILQWARDIGAPAFFNNDDIAWCAVYANRLALACQFPLSGRDYDLVRAKSFATWGQPLAAPALGAWAVFSRPEGFHVGLYLGERADAYRIFGGNTGNAVGATWIATARLLTMRWPAGVTLPITGRVRLMNDGQPRSVDEA